MTALGGFSPGDVLTAAELNQLNNVTALYTASVQSVPNSTATSLTYGAGTEIVDVSGWHSTSSNTERITPNVAGIYLVIANAQLNYVGASKVFEVALFKNTTITTSTIVEGSFYPGGTTAVIIEMNGTTDYVKTEVFHNVGSTTDVFRKGFSCTLLRKT